MKLKDILNISQNKSNSQSIWNPKKRELKKRGLTEDDILNIKVDKLFANKKGQAFFYGLMLSVALIVLILELIPVGQSFIDSVMNQTTGDFIGLDCGNESISDFQKGTCTVLDFSSVYVFGGLLLIALGVLTAKISLGGNK